MTVRNTYAVMQALVQEKGGIDALPTLETGEANVLVGLLAQAAFSDDQQIDQGEKALLRVYGKRMGDAPNHLMAKSIERYAEQTRRARIDQRFAKMVKRCQYLLKLAAQARAGLRGGAYHDKRAFDVFEKTSVPAYHLRLHAALGYVRVALDAGLCGAGARELLTQLERLPTVPHSAHLFEAHTTLFGHSFTNDDPDASVAIDDEVQVANTQALIERTRARLGYETL